MRRIHHQAGAFCIEVLDYLKTRSTATVRIIALADLKKRKPAVLWIETVRIEQRRPYDFQVYFTRADGLPGFFASATPRSKSYALQRAAFLLAVRLQLAEAHLASLLPSPGDGSDDSVLRLQKREPEPAKGSHRHSQREAHEPVARPARISRHEKGAQARKGQDDHEDAGRQARERSQHQSGRHEDRSQHGSLLADGPLRKQPRLSGI